MNSTINRLRNCISIADLISTFQLKISPQQFGYIVYYLQYDQKYETFDIPKRSGKPRTIHAPKAPLKYIQREISTIILNCIDDIRHDNPNYLRCNHAFEKDKSIVSNADLHKNKKFILNIDIKDFFSSIHYGRIKGFFTSDKNFLLHEKIGQIISKLATYNGYLPQGAPTSPILASLIGNIIDVRFLKLAQKYKFTYSRYADDITLSSNQEFPDTLVYWDKEKNIWVAGDEIIKIIKNSGFELNPEKTRYIKSVNRQLVTGVVVNKKRNVSLSYRKMNRAMVYSLFSTGKYTIRTLSGEIKDGKINQLIGRISHCIYVKYHDPKIPNSLDNPRRFNLKKNKKEKLTRSISYNWNKNNKIDLGYTSDHQMMLLRSVLFFKYFIANKKTVIIPEGFTDPIYLKSAASALRISNTLHFQKLNNELRKLGLYGGTSSVNSFLCNVIEKRKGFISYGMLKKTATHPIIFILDYDNGLEDCKFILSKFKDSEQYINIAENIYILLLSVKNKNTHKCSQNHIYIEKLISYNGNEIQVKDSEHEIILFQDKEIKKYDFAKYISEHKNEFSFEKFRNIFDKVSEIESDYQRKLIEKVK